MKKISLIEKRIIRSINRIASSPGNYYAGLKRWGGSLPNNIIIFSRLHRQKLDAEHLSTYFHHRWVLLIAMEGPATVLVNKRAKEISTSSVLLIPPLHFHHYQEASDGRICWLFITFDWPGQDSLPENEQGPYHLTDDALPHVQSMIDLWNEQRPTMTTLLSAELITLILLMFPGIAKRAPSSTEANGESELVTAVREKVAAEPGRAVSIDELAIAIGMSASHLRAKFRADTGISLGRYLREWRLREAALLLSSENISVKETAERLGFRDIYAFSRAFSRAMGLPPSNLRRQL